jgi:hypothetical protein
MGNVDGREKARKKVDLPFGKHFAQQRILARNVPFGVNRVDDESEVIRRIAVGRRKIRVRCVQSLTIPSGAARR